MIIGKLQVLAKLPPYLHKIKLVKSFNRHNKGSRPAYYRIGACYHV